MWYVRLRLLNIGLSSQQTFMPLKLHLKWPRFNENSNCADILIRRGKRNRN